MSEPTGSTDLPDPLGLIRARLETANPELYRHLALYLQILRDVLPARVQQACFHLATQVHPERYARVPAAERRHLHRRISHLVDRCRCLLTVEQLASLAAQMDRERRRDPLRRAGRGMARRAAAEVHATGDRPQEDPDTAMADLPAGSVRLQITPPLSLQSFGWSGAGPLPPLARFAPESGGWIGANPDPFPGAGDGGAGEEDEESEEENLLPDDADPTLPSPWLRGDLPKDPLTLLRWLEGMEGALARRLRNLSHALNVELLRAGLSQGLLPVNLLDAVLEGQLEPDAAPPNLLRLQLPFRSPEGDAPLQAMAVLLRCTDLELEEPRLRTCRRRLQHHRQEVRRMARQFRLLQRRRQSREAERLWLQDSGRTGPSES